MTAQGGFETRLAAWLADGAGTGRTEYLRETLELTERIRQRQAWTFPGRWLPMQLSIRRVEVPRAAYLALAILALLLLLVGAAVLIGARPHPLPPPLGPAANGLIVEDDAGRIVVARTDGNDRRVITSDAEVASDPAWSTDGTRVAFYSWPLRSGLDQNVGAGPPLYDSPEKPLGSLVVVDADGSGRVVLAQGLTLYTGRSVYPPSWSHDGRLIALTVKPGNVPAVEVISSSDGRTVATFANAETPSWSPDDRQLAFRRDDGVIVAALADPSRERVVSRVPGTGFAFSRPEWSPDGRRIVYYAGDDGSHKIYVVDVATGRETRVAEKLSGDQYWPIWSPDGQWLAFKVAIDSNNDAHWVVVPTNDLATWRELQTEPLDPFLGSWSPDGKYLIGHVGNATGSAPDHLLLVDVADPSRSVAIKDAAGLTDWQRAAP